MRGSPPHRSSSMPPRPDLGPKPLLGYTASILARVAERRTDMAFLAACEADQRAGTFAIGGELVVLKKGRNGADPLFRPDEARALAPTAESVFLGVGGERRGVGTAALKGHPAFFVTDLRSIAVQGLVGPEHLAPLAEAKALLAWHARHRFCANCGAPTNVSQAGWKRECPSCKVEHFPRTDPVVIMLAIDGDRCLMGRAGRFVANMWSCLAGFIEPGESIEEAARRETLEEAGIVCGRVKYFASQPWPFPMSLMIGCHAQATSTDITVDREELEDARWFTRDEVVQMFGGEHPEQISIPPPIAIAHHIIRAWVEEDDVFR